MITSEQKHLKEIEIERLWMTTNQSKVVFIGMLPISILLVVGLWDMESHNLLIIWLAIVTTLNFFRWMCFRFYHNHKESFIGSVLQYKRILITSSLLTGFCWGLAVVWFFDPSQPANVMILSIVMLIQAMGAMGTWFCYTPAVIAIVISTLCSLLVLLFLQGDKIYFVTALILTIFTALSTVVSLKARGILTQALCLNFENASLRKESEEKSLLLEKALAEAEQANSAKTRFLAAASHDLRQPMHALGLFFAELSDRVFSQETALVIGQIEDSIAAINSMLNALLDVSKLDAGIVKPIIESVPLSELIMRLQTEFQPIALENNNELRFRPTLAIVHTDPVMLDRILRNLIGNALRYTENGRILVAARLQGQNVDINVLDTGSGIPDEELDEIFIEFHQLQNPARDRRQGLGLGLAIVKRLARLLNHDIKVTSKLGRGSCFSISIPLAEPKTQAVFESSTEKSLLINDSLAGFHILVLDDDIAVLEGMQGLLSRWGCQVITAGSPAEAGRMLAVTRPKLDLLIIDYRLPNHVSGIEVARKLQNSLGYPFAVLIITGDTGPERLKEADASGYPLLHKPVQPAKLRSTLHYILSKLNVDNR